MAGAFRAALAAALLLALAGCAQLGIGGKAGAGAALGHPPGLVIVRSFAAPERAVVLDPSFGFSLRRGAPGVPHAERAAAVARAAAFALADQLVQVLNAAGLDAQTSLDATPTPDAIVVNGTFARIDQGRRRRVGRVGPGAGGSRVIADAEVTVPGGAMVLRVHADSDRLPGEGGFGATSAARGRALPVADANRDAGRIGRAIGRAILAYARRANWLRRGD